MIYYSAFQHLKADRNYKETLYLDPQQFSPAFSIQYVLITCIL